ncbi:uncharacterized protein FIBRA_04637 [Fibroporia radiculosa]|uniref:Uncharacterized protein n=1 Tax=Fibroporia radiculosa TaxID=599839 RepID=J4GPK4_9APHY|nr:uncharacterized protein FIBRA_04637 [Fibroporia radiculosa]CCM02535.1 predicted protein [Fibroporia radiculosa]
MDDSLSSPSRSKPVKVTYSTRRRARRGSARVDYTEDSDGDDAQEDESEEKEAQEAQDSPNEDDSKDEAASEKQEPKKVEVVLPGPSPRSRNHSENSPVPSKPANRAKRSSHSRASSVVSNAIENGNNVSDTPSVNDTSVHNHVPKSPERPSPDDSIGDDRSSIGESSKTRVRKTETERMEFLQSDELSGDVEPHRMFCMGCQEWIDLNHKRRYVMQNWINHRKACSKQRGRSVKSEVLEHKPEVKLDAKSEIGTEDDNISVATPEKPTSILERASKERPSNRIAMAQRKLKLVNDPQVKKLTDQSAECTVCRLEVSVRGEIDYDLALWEEHKATCTIPAPRLPERSNSFASLQAYAADPLSPKAVPSTSTAVHPTIDSVPARPPASAASTDATVIGSDSSPSRASQKRGREDDGEETTRVVRPRTELYEVPEGDSPGFLDWLVLPFRSFVRGFREGMSSS